MTETMYRHAMSTAFKNWPSLALAAVLYAVNVFLLSIGKDMINTSSQSLGGWVVLVVSGYLFIGAVYLVSATLTENSTLSESFPGVIDHFRTFIVGAIAYAIGYFLLFNVAPPLQTNHSKYDQTPMYMNTEKDSLNRVTVLKETAKDIYLIAGRYSGVEGDARLYTPLTDEEKGEIERYLRASHKDAIINHL